VQAAKDHRIAWVTGAGKGIGRQLALRLAEEGWIVAASSRTEADLKDLEAACQSHLIRGFPLDITQAADTEEVVQQIETALGPLDLVVLNAGTHLPMPASEFSTAIFRRLVDTNLMGTVHGLSTIIPPMIARKSGRILVVASLAGYRGLPTAAAYGATKAALINMCEALRPELGKKGVVLQLINPGFVKTPLTDKNKFSMPYLMPVEAAVEAIMRGLRSEKFEIAFPGRFAFLMKVLRCLPDPIFFALTTRMIK
jgi:NAD(P)-dependent dehydrogenase (short-subunit alcohol dehydrogenase family)